MPRREDESRQPHLVGQPAQRFPAYQFRAGVSQEPLALTLEVPVDDVSHDSIEQRVAQELQPLVVHGASLFVATADALVHQCLFIVGNGVRVESDDVVQRSIKLLFLSERELNAVNDIVEIHTLIQHTS